MGARARLDQRQSVAAVFGDITSVTTTAAGDGKCRHGIAAAGVVGHDRARHAIEFSQRLAEARKVKNTAAGDVEAGAISQDIGNAGGQYAAVNMGHAVVVSGGR